MSETGAPPLMVCIEKDRLLKAIELLDGTYAPKVTFCGDYESMKEDAIDQMKIGISYALELLREPFNPQ